MHDSESCAVVGVGGVALVVVGAGGVAGWVSLAPPIRREVDLGNSIGCPAPSTRIDNVAADPLKWWANHHHHREPTEQRPNRRRQNELQWYR